MKKIFPNLLFFFSLLLAAFIFCPMNANASVIFSDEFNGNGELSLYNPSYQKLISFNVGEMTVFQDHVEATGYDPAYAYTGVTENNKCASIDFDWSSGGNWTGIMFNSIPGLIPIGRWSEFNVHGGDHKWFLYRSGHDAIEGNIDIDYSKNHTIKTCITNNIVRNYFDGQLIVAANIDNSSGYLGFSSQIGTKYLDKFTIEENNLEPVNNLNVPLIKQTSPPWKNQIYDSANNWNPNDPTINSFGCAISSAAMIFKYYGINKLPDNKNLDPGTLNTWLKSQKDGYVGNGLTNWLALSRLSRLAKRVNNLNYDALEYERVDGNATVKLTEIINNNQPGILSVPDHFIVAKGIDNGIFTINDPYYPRTDLTSYNNTFKNVGIYKKSNTDLSYIMLAIGLNTNIELIDSNGNSVGETFIEDGISNPINSNQKTGPLKIVYLAKPAEENYTVILSNNGNPNFNLKTFLYDKNGDVYTRSYSGSVQVEQSKEITINYNNSENIYFKKVTYLSTLLDIEKLRKQKLITKDDVKSDLLEKLALAFTQNSLKNKEKELKYLNDFENIINKNNGGKITEPAYESLLYDINYLTSHI